MLPSPPLFPPLGEEATLLRFRPLCELRALCDTRRGSSMASSPGAVKHPLPRLPLCGPQLELEGESIYVGRELSRDFSLVQTWKDVLNSRDRCTLPLIALLNAFAIGGMLTILRAYASDDWHFAGQLATALVLATMVLKLLSQLLMVRLFAAYARPRSMLCTSLLFSLVYALAQGLIQQAYLLFLCSLLQLFMQGDSVITALVCETIEVEQEMPRTTHMLGISSDLQLWLTAGGLGQQA